MRSLTILLAEPSPARLRSALTAALAQAALGGKACLFIDMAAVPLIRSPIVSADDGVHRAAGLPTMSQLFEEAFAVGVRICACQTGLALSGESAEAYDPRIDWAGITSLLAGLGDDRLLAF